MSTDTKDSVLTRFVEVDRILQLPAKHTKRMFVLEWLVERFDWDRDYEETEVNALLSGHEPDHVYLRRLLVDHRFLNREQGIYRRLNRERAFGETDPDSPA